MTMAELDGKGCGPESGSPFEGEEAVRMEESSPITVFRNVNKYFGSLHVLKDLNFEIMRGEVVVICGPSGSGKSTLIRCINKLEPIASGVIVVDGVNLKSRSREITKLRADIGMVFQHFNLYPHLTVLQNVALAPVLVRGISKPEGHDYARELLGKVGILNKESAYPGLLSGGQQQRVAIARAMAMNPKILLFDEPTSALDPEMIQDDTGSVGRHGGARPRRHDNGRCHARDGFRPQGSGPYRLHGVGPDRRTELAERVFPQPA